VREAYRSLRSDVRRLGIVFVAVLTGVCRAAAESTAAFPEQVAWTFQEMEDQLDQRWGPRWGTLLVRGMWKAVIRGAQRGQPAVNRLRRRTVRVDERILEKAYPHGKHRASGRGGALGAGRRETRRWGTEKNEPGCG
jgi:hypothetical protein